MNEINNLNDLNKENNLNSKKEFKPFTLSDFDFDLPPELIAQHPSTERTHSRLLDGRKHSLNDFPKHRIFKELPDLLQSGDLLVFNDTKVIKARLFGEKPSGGKLELLIERVLNQNEVIAQMKVSKKPSIGSILRMVGGFSALFLGRYPDENGSLFHLRFDGNPYELMQKHGHVPLPPYISHADDAQDEQRYQTVFAKNAGAVAAPTAALHFDEALLKTLKDKQIDSAYLTLHVGSGTFQPVKTENLSEHKMHSEYFEIPPETLSSLERCRKRGGRVIAVGTTSVRTLETWAQTGQTSGETQIFITPGFQFKIVDLLITNFHLPKSTLMMLVSAFSGFEHTKMLYQTAINYQYRFFSYGDSMILERD